MARIDPVTADKIRQVLLMARSRGVDPVALLDHAGLLSYEAARRKYGAALVQAVIYELTIGPSGLALNAMSLRTPADMRTEIVKILEAMVHTWQHSDPPTPPRT